MPRLFPNVNAKLFVENLVNDYSDEYDSLSNAPFFSQVKNVNRLFGQCFVETYPSNLER